MTRIRHRHQLALLRSFTVCTWFILAPAWAAAQPPTWTVEFGRERAAVSTHHVDSTWTVDRVQAVRSAPDLGGLVFTVERQERYGNQDLALLGRAYKRAGDWTFGVNVGGSPDAEFLYHARGGGEVSYRAIGGLVASTAYEYLHFPSAHLHQLQPALTLYHARGEVEARVYVTRNATRSRTSTATLLRTEYDLTPRFRLGGGAAVGDRIFDVASLPTGTARGRLGFVNARIGFTEHDFLTVRVSVADEDPAFTYWSWTLGYRRVF